MSIKYSNHTELEAQRTRIKPPPLFKVLLLNDDFTPMDFVVTVLERFFGKNHEQALHIMLKIHHEGVGLCGVYAPDVAEIKVKQVSVFSEGHQHPLQCVMEEE